MHTIRDRFRRDDGQGTVEYVFVMLVAAAIAWALIQWIRGGGTSSIWDTIGSWVTNLVGLFGAFFG
jgi:hypothetical protein